MRFRASDAARELTLRFCEVAHARLGADVLDAALNMAVNVIRQSAPTQRDALARWDEVSAQMRAFLASHYDNGGARLNVFPFTQHLRARPWGAAPRLRK